MHNALGFTLIELLIATTLLSMVLLIGSYSYGLFSNGWNKELGNFKHSANQARNISLLQSVLDGIAPQLIHNKDDEIGFFFEGTQHSILSITHNGLFDNSYPVIFKLSLQTGNDGKQYLLYQEKSTRDFQLINFEQTFTFEHQWIFVSNVDILTLQYFGWDNFDVKSDIQMNNFPPSNSLKWQSEFSGFKRKLLPEEIQLEIKLLSKPDIIFNIKTETAPVEFFLQQYQQ